MPRMAAGHHELRVAQHDLRSVRIDVGPVRFVLRYGFTFDGNERLPESVAVSGNEVTAFFLSSTVRDRISATPTGFEVHRRWTVLQSGQIRLVLALDIPDAPAAVARVGARRPPTRSYRFLFPGVAAGGRVDGEGCMVRADRTALPACVILAAEDVGIGAWVHPGRDERGSSVGLGRSVEDGTGCTRLVFETPAREYGARRLLAPGDQAGDPGDGSEESIASVGRLEHEVLLHVAVCSPETVYAAVLSAALGRGAPGGEGKRLALREETRAFLATHLVDQGGVCGLRVVAGSDILSAGAGVELAALICRLAPRDAELLETAQRLADFAILGQQPSGLFYERYSLKERSWVGLRGAVPGRGSRPVLVSVEESSRVATSLFDFAEAISGLGFETSRYGLAARRMVDAFFDARGSFTHPGAVMTADCSATVEEGLGSLRFLHPLLRVVDRDRRERYRKAAATMVARWLERPIAPLSLPASREGREPDSKAILLLLEAALEAAARKLRVKSLASLAGGLLPWVYLGGPGRGPVPGAGAVADGFARARFRPRPAQIACLCHRLAASAKGGLRDMLEAVGGSAQAAVGSLPLGCSSVERANWGRAEAGRSRFRLRRRGRPESVDGFVVGPADARDFVIELGSSILSEEEAG